MKVHLNDEVLVITGKDRGKTGRVMRVIPKHNRIVVEKVNIRTKHVKKSADRKGERIHFESSIDASNVKVLTPISKTPSRIGYIILKNGQKQRIAKKKPDENLHQVTEKKRTTKR